MLKKLSLAALALAASAPAFANPPHWAPAHAWRGHRQAVVRYYPVAPVVVHSYVAPRYYYAPPPVVYRPVPVAPRPAPTFSIRFDLPL
jgi:hypothetical protein